MLLDQNEDPVVDAEVYFRTGEMTMAPDFGKVTTNMQGEYEFAGLPMNEKIIVSPNPDGYKYQSQEIVLTDGAGAVLTNVNLVCEKLPYGGDTVITVLSEDGTPVEGAELFNRGSASDDVRTATTNAEGNARLVNMFKFEDSCNVVIRAKGKVPTHFTMEPGSAEDPTNKTLTLANGRTLRGQLLNPEGEPAGGVAVFLYNVHTSPFWGEPKDLKWPRVLTDAEGKFESNEMEGDTDITVYTPRNCAPIKSLAVELDGDETEITIKMEPAARIRVRAIDSETGDPIPAFNVKPDRVEELDRLDGDLPSDGIEVSLMNPGRNVHGTMKEYVLDGQTPNAVFGVIVSAEGYELATIKRLRCEVDAEVHDVKLVKSTDK
ncbi:MAG: carboxypeptidase-like regulatory domain-containing protein [Pirellulaceae bacterium]